MAAAACQDGSTRQTARCSCSSMTWWRRSSSRCTASVRSLAWSSTPDRCPWCGGLAQAHTEGLQHGEALSVGGIDGSAVCAYLAVAELVPAAVGRPLLQHVHAVHPELDRRARPPALAVGHRDPGWGAEHGLDGRDTVDQLESVGSDAGHRVLLVVIHGDLRRAEALLVRGVIVQ